MIKYQDYEQEFNQLGISQTDACILLDYMQAIAEIGIRFLSSTYKCNFLGADNKQ